MGPASQHACRNLELKLLGLGFGLGVALGASREHLGFSEMVGGEGERQG